MILPERVLGKESVKRISRDERSHQFLAPHAALIEAQFLTLVVESLLESQSNNVFPFEFIGLLTTAASATAGKPKLTQLPSSLVGVLIR